MTAPLKGDKDVGLFQDASVGESRNKSHLRKMRSTSSFRRFDHRFRVAKPSKYERQFRHKAFVRTYEWPCKSHQGLAIAIYIVDTKSKWLFGVLGVLPARQAGTKFDQLVVWDFSVRYTEPLMSYFKRNFVVMQIDSGSRGKSGRTCKRSGRERWKCRWLLKSWTRLLFTSLHSGFSLKKHDE